MNKFAFALIAGLVAVGCTDSDKDTGADSGSTADGGTTDGGAGDGGSDETLVACSWSSSEFNIDITNGDAAGYSLGFAETGGSPSWTGEDCGYVGYKANDGTFYDYCHDISATGATLTIVSTFEDINPGSTTILNGASMDIAYYLYEEGTGSCWTWGSDASYFFDCTDASAAITCSGD